MKLNKLNKINKLIRNSEVIEIPQCVCKNTSGILIGNVIICNHCTMVYEVVDDA